MKSKITTKTILQWLVIAAIVLIVGSWSHIAKALGQKEQHKSVSLLVNIHLREDTDSTDKLVQQVLDYSKSEQSKEYKEVKGDLTLDARPLFDSDPRYVSLDKIYVNGTAFDFDDCNLNQNGDYPNGNTTCFIYFDDDTVADVRIKQL